MVSTNKSVIRRVFGVIGLIIAALGWLFLAPQSVGGNVAYAVVTGQSMEPDLSSGDLVIVREQTAYSVGEAIAYRSRNLGQIVLHRVVADEGGRFVTKGDNNDFLDGDRPTDAEVIGKQWIHVPRAGAVFTFLRSTVGMALGCVGILGLLGFFSVKERRRRRNGKHRQDRPDGKEDTLPAPALGPLSTPASPMRRRLQVAAAVAAAAVVVTAGVTYAAFERPLFRAQPTEIGVVHRGQFAYSASTPRGPVYQTSRLSSGDPVFVRLVRDVQLSFDYDFETDAAFDGDVTGDMRVVLRSDNGWEHEIKVAPSTSARRSLDLDGRLVLGDMRSTLAQVENMTGMAPGTYSVAVEPRVRVEGTVEGEPISETFAPVLPFQLSDIQLGLVRPQENGLEQGLEQVLNPVQKTTITVDRLVPDPFSIWGREVPVLAVRRVGLVFSALSLLALIFAGLLWLRRRPKDEAGRIEARFSSLLIPVQDAAGLQQEAIEVSDIETLVRLAQQFEQPIMHRSLGAGAHSYSLHYDGLLYSYQISGDEDDVPILRFDPRPPVYRPAVRAVLTRPSRSDANGGTEERTEVSG